MRVRYKCLILVVMALVLLWQAPVFAKERIAVNLVLQTNTAAGNVLRGLISYHLIYKHSIETKDDARYTVIISHLKKSIWQGILSGGNNNYMFASVIILDNSDIQGGSASVRRWDSNTERKLLSQALAYSIYSTLSQSKSKKEVPK